MGWGRVYGGAEGGSGWKPEKPKPTEAWKHDCEEQELTLPAHFLNCPFCFTRRPY